MKILHTNQITNPSSLPPSARLAFYNGFDTMLVLEIHRKLNAQMDPTTEATYLFERALQAPTLSLMVNGTWVDQVERQRKILLLERQIKHLLIVINRYANATWGKNLNPGSWQQKAAYFYDFLQIPPVKKFDPATHKMKVTTNRDALEKVRDQNVVALAQVNAVLAYQDAKKALGTLKSGIEDDGFFRASYNIAGTETGRFSSKKNCFGRGANDQNWREELRSIFSAPPGPLPGREQFNIPAEHQSLSFPTHLRRLRKNTRSTQ